MHTSRRQTSSLWRRLTIRTPPLPRVIRCQALQSKPQEQFTHSTSRSGGTHNKGCQGLNSAAGVRILRIGGVMVLYMMHCTKAY